MSGMLQAFNGSFYTLASASGWQANSITGGLVNNAFTNVSNSIESTGNSLVYILMMIIGFVGVIGLGIAVLKIMIGNSMTKSAAKGELLWILVAGIIGFGAMSIIGLLQTIGGGLFTL